MARQPTSDKSDKPGAPGAAAVTRGWRFPAAFGLSLLASAPALAGVTDLFHQGAETKAHAGAGQLYSRGAPANYHNPANLIEGQAKFEPYFGLDLIFLAYSYEYPGYDPVQVNATVPYPFLGLTWRPIERLSVAFNFLPMPESSGERTLEDLPTRKFAADADSDPILMDVTTGGNGFGYSMTLGAAYKVMNGLGVGLSLLMSEGGGTMSASETDTEDPLIEQKSRSGSYSFIGGVRASAMKGKLNSAFTLKPPSSTSSETETRYPSLTDETQKTSKTSKGPWEYGFGIDYRLPWSFSLFMEYSYTQWEDLRKQKEEQVLEKVDVEYFNTSDIVVGADYFWGVHRFNLAYGMYQSYIGDGIMKSESDDNIELIGMEMQNTDGVPHTVIAGGWRMGWQDKWLQTGFYSLQGERDVWKKARGYGHYELAVFSVFAGGALRF